MLIVGSRGVGKTWMLGQIRSALGPDAAIVRLSASKALASIPFGAVNARVGAKLVRSNDYYEVLNGLLGQVSLGLETAKHVVLMVDNAEFLDSNSAAIILQVVMSTEARLILVDQPGGHNTHLRELWRDGHLTRFELAPLHSEDVQVFLEDFLGGKVAGPTADYLTRRSAGNPLVLQGLVTGAQEEGSLRRANNVWVLDHPGDKLGTESWEFLQMDLDHLQPDSKRIIEILALAGKLPLDVLLDLTSAEAVDDIQQRELVEIMPGPQLTMRLARAVTAPAIRSTIPVGRSRKYLADVARLLPDDGRTSPEAIINFTRWSMECGMAVSEERLLEATTCANQLMRSNDALEFSNRKVFSRESAALLAERAIATMTQNLPDEARALAVQAFALAENPEDAARALHAVHLSHFSDVEYQNRLKEAFADFEARFGTPALNDSSTEADIAVLIIRATMEVSTGEIAQAKQRIEALREHPLTDNIGDRVLLKSLYSEILSATGRLDSAVALAMEVIGELEDPAGFPRPDISILAYTRSVAAFIYDGAWDYVRAALHPDTFENPDLMLHSGGLRDLAAAMMACRRGHMEEVLNALEPAVSALTDYDPWSVLPTALGIRAYGQVMSGDIAASQESLVQLAALNQRSGKFYELEGAAYAAAAQCMTGQGELGLARLRSLQRECVAHGYLGIEITVLSLLLRVGESTAVSRLAEVSEMLESTSKEFFVSWAKAMHSQDPTVLDSASATAMDFGYELIGVELATHALRKFHDRGKVHRSRKTASKVVAMREQMPGLVSPVFQTIDQPKMTRREHQIALLVAQGESNNSIASRLNVSLRTIEGHLYRTFIKLDLQSRDQLAALMNGAAVPDDTDAYYS
ncbi:hypothetical protein ART_2783 [Arthrobacter sp. PAMC 25486]|uniref:helix-turn-helix transcriptional regulator n=1 Tax=Arthrobacter sp. PAMC 25486 TaxID=1494608 RepID=UPI000535EA5C|nr:hypothetical protein ART_2783 [Arthrobacter sp. PAMC 25486]